MKLPQGTDVRALFEAAVQRNVAFVPGQTFFARPDAPPTARLNFSCMDEARIMEGIRRFAEVIAEMQPASPTY